MGVSLRLFGFVFGIFYITFAQGQNCLSSDIGKLEDTEPLDKPSYTDGETVKVNCITGFSGMYKFKCLKGNWDKTLERKCTKKKCGHPGDMPNGDFRLLGGNTEFVFGATVQYTCNKGYEMASRINQRTCRNGGWDNAVPACEVLKCPPIHTEEDVIASGNTEEGGYGEVVQFDCKSPDKKIDGSNDIYCKENGEWSASVPKCIEISCKLPNIQHGTVKQVKDYKKDDTLQYDCDPGYKPRQGTPKCTKHGWTLEAECEELTCELRDTKFGIERIQPEGKHFFRVGETVQIRCSKRYRLFLTKEIVRSFECKDNGQWDNTPVCEEITCKVPSDPRLSYFEPYYFSGNLKLDEKRSYKCFDHYRQMANEATCTEDGLKPYPLCDEITCELSEMGFGMERIEPEGKKKFRVGETVRITCSERYRIFLTKETVKSFKCKHDGQWDKMPVCEEITCEVPSDRHRLYSFQSSDSNLRLNERRSYKCMPDYPQMANEATCTEDGLKPDPLCDEKKKSCTTPTVENGYLDRERPNDEMLHYACNTGYKPYTGNWWGEATCTNGTWKDEPRCIKKDECGVWPSIQHGQLNNHTEQSVLELKCDPGFKPSHTVIRCVNGTWETATCKLDEQSCVIPPKVENALIIAKPQTVYASGSYVNYKCRTNITMSGISKIKCHNATWEEAPTCEAFCSKPLQEVNNAKLIDQIQGERKYSHGGTAHYKCDEDYESNGPTIAKCDGPTWIYPECIKKAQCTKPTMNLQFVTLLDEKNTFNDFDILRYTCNKPYDKIPNGALICKDGKWNGTLDCTSSICPPPPMIEDGVLNVERMADEVITIVSYLCQAYYVLNKQQRYYRCLNKIWETPPKCLKPCKITPDIYKEYNIKPIPDDYIKHSAREVRLDCNNGWTVGGPSRRPYSTARCTDGELGIESKCSRNKSG